MKRDDPTYLRSVNAMLAAEASPERAALVARKQTAMRPVADLAEWPQPLDLRDMAESPLQRPQFLIADWLPAGYATLLAGHGGVGKSAIGLHMAVCVAMGLPFCGMPTERRRVTYLSCEDRDDVLHWRLAHICNYLGIGIADLHGWLHCIDLVGCDSILWARNLRTGNTITPAFGFLDAHIERYLPEVLFVDGIADTFGGNENAWAEIKAFVNQLLAMITLDGALVLLGHVAKPTATNSATGEGYSGSTSWHNAVRARWYLYPETEQDDENTARTRRTGKRTLELQKSNLGKTDQMLTFAWDDDARMFLPNSTFGGSRIDRKHRDDTEQSGLVLTLTTCCRANIIVPAADRGQRTAFNVLAKRPEFPASLKGSSKRFWPHRGAAAITPHRGIRISPHRPSLRSRIASHFRLMRACGQYPFKVCPHIAISPSAGLAGNSA